MPRRRIDAGIKIAAMRLYDRQLLPLGTILDIVGFSETPFAELFLRSGIPFKQLRKIAAERSEVKRMRFRDEIADYDPEQLGFIDETSVDERTSGRRKGRAKRGQRATMSLLSIDGMIASTVCQGSMTTEKLAEFLQDDVLPLCAPFPGKLSVLVLDNAKIHHGEGIKEFIREAL
ncbi:hypothetical protein MPER_07219, partial [Moniliophthora perniciosa FA553]